MCSVHAAWLAPALCPARSIALGRARLMHGANKTLVNILFGLVVAAVVGIMTGSARADGLDCDAAEMPAVDLEQQSTRL